MIDSCTRSTDGKTFTLSINGEPHTYTNDKEGKRQAIVDGLNAIETVAMSNISNHRIISTIRLTANQNETASIVWSAWRSIPMKPGA